MHPLEWEKFNPVQIFFQTVLNEVNNCVGKWWKNRAIKNAFLCKRVYDYALIIIKKYTLKVIMKMAAFKMSHKFGFYGAIWKLIKCLMDGQCVYSSDLGADKSIKTLGL